MMYHMVAVHAVKKKYTREGEKQLEIMCGIGIYDTSALLLHFTAVCLPHKQSRRQNKPIYTWYEAVTTYEYVHEVYAMRAMALRPFMNESPPTIKNRDMYPTNPAGNR